MEKEGGMAVSKWVPDVLLGRTLNDVEEKNAPPVLYTAGPMTIPLPGPRVAIVGTRHPTAEGVANARAVARALAKEGVVVVSGLARGIDTAAHKVAIESGGKTIAVLGTPLNRSYPAENAMLQAEIIKDHLAVSQFKIGSNVFPTNFIIRNRTMALVADASVIIEAGETSGSISQGYEALRLGRPLFIWKSLFDSQKWPKEMSRYAAKRLSDPKAIFPHLPPSRGTLQVVA